MMSMMRMTGVIIEKMVMVEDGIQHENHTRSVRDILYVM